MNKPIGFGNIHKKTLSFTELKLKQNTCHNHFSRPRLLKKILRQNKDIRLERIHSILNPDIPYYLINTK